MDKETIIKDLETIKQHFLTETGGAFPEALDEAIKACKAPAWIPVTTRQMTAEEATAYAKRLDMSPIELIKAGGRIFTCRMPEFRQEIIISTSYGVSVDVCDLDEYGSYALEERGDWEGVDAWMPMPERYQDTKNEP